mgnify:FL=1
MKSKNKAMNIIYSAFAFLSIIFVAGLASAALTLPTQAISVSGNHNTDVSFTFSVTSVTAHSQLKFLFDSPLPSGVSQNTFTPISITPQETKTVSISLHIDKSTPPTTEPHVLSLKAKAGNDDLGSVPISLTIASSPALTIIKTRELTVNQTGLITVNNTGNTQLNGDITSSDANIALSTNSFSLLAPGTGSSPITVRIADLAKLKFGTNPVTITATSGQTSDTETFTLSKSFCRNGQKGNLSLSSVDVNNEGEGDDDEWNFLDTITIEVEVDNNAEEDIDDVQVELGLFDSAGRNMINDLDFANKDDERIEVGDINNGDEETANFEITVPADLDSGSYRLAVKAYSKKSGIGESNICADSSDDLSDTIFQSIRVEKEDDEGKRIAFDRIELRPSEATCGDTVSLSFDAVNIGDEDEDQVKVNVVSTELKVDASQEIKQGLDQGDKRAMTFTFTVPEGLADKSYRIMLDANYDYRNGVYRESLDDPLDVLLKVFGCTAQAPISQPSQRIASITASLESEAQAGQQMEVDATIRNLGNTSSTFLISADGYQSWAELQDISDRVLSVEAGESKEVTFAFLVDEGVDGEQTFSIDVRSGDKRETREVVVDIQGETSAQMPDISQLLQGNSLIWIIAIVNIILIVLIIIIAVRISRK